MGVVLISEAVCCYFLRSSEEGRICAGAVVGAVGDGMPGCAVIITVFKFENENSVCFHHI